MSVSDYAPPSLEVARNNLRVLFRAFGEATGYPPTFIGFVARGEPKWARQFEERDFVHSSYDTAVSRLSALWPADVPWPVEVPRQAPSEIPADILEAIEARKERQEAPAPVALPGGADWPDDIPMPGHNAPANAEGGHHGKENES